MVFGQGTMRRSLVAILAVLALGSVITPGAIAFDEIGNPCVGDDTEAGTTMIGLSNQGSEPLMNPIVPPEHKFVITRWRVKVGAGVGPLAQQLVASHQVGEEDDVKVGESAVETLVAGSNEFATRIPVSEYDHVGLRGPEQTLICNQALNTAGRVKGGWATEEQRHFEVLVNVGVPVVARVERDADSDGYGDETQDGCPVNGAFQTACPALTVTTRREVKRRAILVHVTTTNDSSAVVSGRIGWNVRRADESKRRLIVGLSAGRSQNLTAGATTTFRVPLPKSVQRRLERLTPMQTMRANLAVSVADVFKAQAQQRLVVRLRGRG
jgi:hypothetical protein